MVDPHDAWLRDELHRRHFWVASKDPESDVELPLRILVLGDLTQRSDPRPLAARRPVVITRDTFDPVLAEQALTLELTVPDLLSPEPGGPMRVQLSFTRLKDFTPEGIVRQVPALDDLLELRSAVSAIRGPLGPIPSFVKRLRAVVLEDDSRQQLRRELSAPPRVPADLIHDETLIGELLVEAHCGPQEEGHRVVRRGLEALLAAALSPRYAGQAPNRDLANQVLDEIDGRRGGRRGPRRPAAIPETPARTTASGAARAAPPGGSASGRGRRRTRSARRRAPQSGQTGR